LDSRAQSASFFTLTELPLFKTGQILLGLDLCSDLRCLAGKLGPAFRGNIPRPVHWGQLLIPLLRSSFGWAPLGECRSNRQAHGNRGHG